MITIRDEQLAAFDEAALESTTLELAVHARKHFSQLLASVQEAQLLRALRRMAQEAFSLGLTRKDELALFVNLSLAFGEDFTQRRELLWLQEILGDQRRTPGERIRRIHAEAVTRGA